MHDDEKDPVEDKDDDDDTYVGICQGGRRLWGAITECRAEYAEGCEFDQGVTRYAHTGIANETWKVILMNHYPS